MGKKRLLRALIFIIVLVMAIAAVDSVFGIDDSNAYNSRRAFLKEKKGSMDAVIIGASNVIAYWQPLFGWADHGIAVWSYSVSDLTCAALKYMIIESRKTQPDALYILNLSNFKGSKVSLDAQRIHRAVDYMPMSMNRINLTRDLVARAGFGLMESVEFYMPVVRFHSRWDELDSWAFGASEDGKMSRHATDFCEKVQNVDGRFKLTDIRKPMTGDVGQVFTELLDYCDREGVRLLFVKSPQVVNATQQGHMNELEAILAERGYPCLDLLEDMESTGIDPRTDFYNSKHTNIHGSLKFCKALGDYLVENYHFQDKRGQAGWESWDAAAVKYDEFCSKYSMEFERKHSPRFSCDIPAVSLLGVDKEGIALEWQAIDEADGYLVYQRIDDGDDETGWECVAELDAGTTEYLAVGLKSMKRYRFTVVPVRRDRKGNVEYGSFDPTGLSARAKGTEA